MTCADCRPLLHAHVDGELDLVTDVAVTAHVKDCPACAGQLEAIKALREAVIRGGARHRMPEALRSKLTSAARIERPAPAAPPRSRLPRLLAMAAGIAMAVAAGYSLDHYQTRAGLIVEEGLNAHLRSLQPMHPMDVVSTDRHTVKPWFAGRLDFSPPVVDLADSGYPLAGGRLEVMDGRTAAALIFHKKLHAISLFVWPGAAAAPAQSRYGYSARGWTHGGLSFLAVSDIPADELAQFVELYRSRAD